MSRYLAVNTSSRMWPWIWHLMFLSNSYKLKLTVYQKGTALLIFSSIIGMLKSPCSLTPSDYHTEPCWVCVCQQIINNGEKRGTQHSPLCPLINRDYRQTTSPTQLVNELNWDTRETHRLLNQRTMSYKIYTQSRNILSCLHRALD